MYVLRTMNSLRTSFWIVPVELLRCDALLLGGDDVEREDRQHGAVHRHRHAHLVERDPVEELPHVEDRVDRHAGHPDVAGDPRMVAVVAAVRGEVERDRQALLAGGQVAAVERVRVLGGGEAGVLADRPRLVDVHRRVRPADVRRRGPGTSRGSRGPSRSEPSYMIGTSMPSGVFHVRSSACGPSRSPPRRPSRSRCRWPRRRRGRSRTGRESS